MKKLHNMYLSPNFIMTIKSKRNGWARQVAFLRELRNVDILRQKNRRELVGRRSCIWRKINITMDLRETESIVLGWIHFTQ
jgi:hypothetical protein